MRYAIVPLAWLMEPGESIVAMASAGVYVAQLWGGLVAGKPYTIRFVRYVNVVH